MTVKRWARDFAPFSWGAFKKCLSISSNSSCDGFQSSSPSDKYLTDIPSTSEIGNNIVLERGLGENEAVVIEGYHKLVPGMLVRPVQAGDDKAIEAYREEAGE